MPTEPNPTTADEGLLIEAARDALTRAHAPYSRFPVGAALEIAGGEPACGCNVENASFGLALCAERVAIFSAQARGLRPGARLVIVSEAAEPTPPCGACRQVLRELAPETMVISISRDGQRRQWMPGEMLTARRRSGAIGALDPPGLIARKRDGEALSRDEIELLVRALLQGEIEEYQMAAFMMAVYLRGMSAREIRDLTRAMLTSGSRLDLSAVGGPRIDKHSTGGVGDKISLALLPLALACGIRVPMISGRGLGHTGGTLDKLESIPGYRTTLPITELQRLTSSPGGFIAGQTAELVPADRTMYALRDVTATVGSVPLIVSSILSKKLAADLTGLVLDVKFGRGAFISERAEAEELARTLVRVAAELGLPAVALLTRMDAPIGRAVGNALEVRESFALLSGVEIDPDVRELTLALTGLMVALSGRAQTMADGARLAEERRAAGVAAESAAAWLAAQGGDPAVVADPMRLSVSPRQRIVTARQEGYVREIDARRAGQLCVTLGGGRQRTGDGVDHGVGLVFHCRCGDRVASGDPLVTLYLPEGGDPAAALPGEESLVTLGAKPPDPPPRIAALVTPAGVFSDPWDVPLGDLAAATE